MKRLDHIIEKTLLSLIEQAAPVKKETDNAPSDADVSPFTPAEEKFLGKFDAYGTTHIGIIYSPSDIGIREFITRSGNDLNLTPEILLNLIRNNIVKIVPYTGYGRNTDYTIELQLTLDDVKGLGKEDKEKAEAGSTASGAEAGAAEMTTPEPSAPAPEVAWVIPYGELIRESVVITKKLTEAKTSKSDVDVDKSRLLKKLPKSVINDLERILDKFLKRATNASEKQRLVADILDNLAKNLKLTPKQIQRSYEYHKTQKRLQETLNVNLDWQVNILLEQRDETKITSWLNKKYPNLKYDIDQASNFWQTINSVNLEGMDWDENKFFDAFGDYVFKASDARRRAIIIDALGNIIIQANQSNQEKAYPAIRFLREWIGPEWDSLLPLPIRYGISGIYTLSTLINKDVVEYILNDNKFPKWNQDLNRKGVGQVLKTSSKQFKYFFPTYKDSEVNAWVIKLLAPYQPNAKLDSIKSPSFGDTLSKDEKQIRAKRAISQINSAMKTKFVTNRPAGIDFPKIESLVGYTGSWVDNNGLGFALFNDISGNKLRLYPDGKYTILNPTTGKIMKKGSWYLEYNTSKRNWDIIKS